MLNVAKASHLLPWDEKTISVFQDTLTKFSRHLSDFGTSVKLKYLHSLSAAFIVRNINCGNHGIRDQAPCYSSEQLIVDSLQAITLSTVQIYRLTCINPNDWWASGFTRFKNKVRNQYFHSNDNYEVTMMKLHNSQFESK